jgi:hypothetical protein
MPDQPDFILTLLLEIRASLQRIEAKLDEFAATKSRLPEPTPERPSRST